MAYPQQQWYQQAPGFYAAAIQPYTRPMPKRAVRSERKKSNAHFKLLSQCVLIVCMVFMALQCLRTTGMNVQKCVGLLANKTTVDTLYQHEVQTQQGLQEKINYFQSQDGVEALARRQLSLVGAGEIPVFLNR